MSANTMVTVDNLCARITGTESKFIVLETEKHEIWINVRGDKQEQTKVLRTIATSILTACDELDSLTDSQMHDQLIDYSSTE
jgi:hypothetical protein